MKKQNGLYASLFAILMLLLWIPAMTEAQPPPVGGPLVREGDFAVRLLTALDLGATDDEIEAETRLGAVGIIPRNGWIADYPVTPDIVGELQKSVADAAASRRIPLSRDEALQRFSAVNDEFELAVRPYTGTKTSSAEPSAEGYANPESINDYYAYEGDPVYTYYTPPPDYYYLYAWVPYPFWCRGFWFPGFFILRDFHKHIVVHNRVAFISNHFNDVSHHRVFRIDPVVRFNGKTFAGIGAPRSKNFISTGVPRSEREVFNAPPERRALGTVSPPWGTPGKSGPPWGTPGTVSPAPRSGDRVLPPSHRGETTGPQPRPEVIIRPQPPSERMVSPQPHSDGSSSPSPHGSGGFGRGR